jgi:hypothetical protein
VANRLGYVTPVTKAYREHRSTRSDGRHDEVRAGGRRVADLTGSDIRVYIRIYGGTDVTA